MRSTLHTHHSYPTLDLERLESCNRTTHHDHIDHERLAAEWEFGNGISARHGPPKSKTGEPTFQSAGFIAVAIDLTNLPRSAVLASLYTSRYCSVAAYPDGDGHAGVCLLAFELPAAETDPSRYALLQAGLEARYRGARLSAGVLQIYRGENAHQVRAFGRALDAEAVRELMQLGKETKEIGRKPDDLIRSRLLLSADQVIRTTCGRNLTVGELHPETQAFCPVHVDVRPTAQAFRLRDGRPILACIHCQRAFTVRDATNDYDFGHFDRTVRELADLERQELDWLSGAETGDQQFDIRTERYLGKLPLRPGVLCVKSPKGSGKTEQLADFVGRCKAAKQRILLIGHRRTLLSNLAKRLRLSCYIVSESDADIREKRNRAMFSKLVELPDVPPLIGPDPIDATDEGSDLKQGRPSARYAVSLDSLTVLRPNADKYHTVIIDEAEQVFAHLVGSTLREKRQPSFHRLRHYLRVAKTVVLLDADLGMVTMESLFNMRLLDDVAMSFVLNDHKQESRVVQMYESQGQLVDRLREAVDAGEKCYVATNSKNKAIELQKALSKDWPDRRVVAVHSDNVSSTDVQHLVANLADAFERTIDVLIASPALGTGVDITFKSVNPDDEGRTVVTHVFGLFIGNVTTHLDMDQQLMRVRHPRQVHVWVDPIEQYFETDMSVISEQLARTVGETRTLLGYDDQGEPILAPEDGLIDIWTRVRAANCGSKNRLGTLFRRLREENGWRLVEVPREGDAASDGAATLKKGKELRLTEREAQILAARVIDQQTADRLKWRKKQSLAMSIADRAALERHRLEHFYREAVSEELIELDCDGRLQRSIVHLECLLAPGFLNDAFDKKQRLNAVWAADLGVRCAKANLLRDVLGAAGVYDAKSRQINDGVILEQGNLAPFVTSLRKRRKQIESVFELVPRKDADIKRVQQLSVILEKIGLKLDSARESDVDGKKVRRYGLDLDRLARVRQILRQRSDAQTRPTGQDEGGPDPSLEGICALTSLKAMMEHSPSAT